MAHTFFAQPYISRALYDFLERIDKRCGIYAVADIRRSGLYVRFLGKQNSTFKKNGNFDKNKRNYTNKFTSRCSSSPFLVSSRLFLLVCISSCVSCLLTAFPCFVAFFALLTVCFGSPFLKNLSFSRQFCFCSFFAGKYKVL